MASEILPQWDHFREEPLDISDAIARIARLATLRGWLTEVEQPIRGWLEQRADAAEAMLGKGASFRAPIEDVGLALRTRPQPKPSIADREQFARWLLRDVIGTNPDGDASLRHIEWGAPPLVVRRDVATCESEPLLALADAIHDPSSEEGDDADAIYAVVDAIRIERQWHVDDQVLDDLLAGKMYQRDDDGTPCVKVTDDLRVVDTLTGEPVPGTRVSPPGQRVLQVTPAKELKQALRAELEALVGPPALDPGE